MNQIHHVTQPVRLKVNLMFQNCSVPYYYQNGSITEGVTFLVVITSSVLSLCGEKRNFYLLKTIIGTWLQYTRLDHVFP